MKFILIFLLFNLTLRPCFSKDKITIPLQYMPQSLKPALCNDTNCQFVLNNASDGLIGWTYRNGIFPQIAASWSEISSGRILFKLRDNLQNYDGKKIVCSDIASILNVQKLKEGPFKSSFDKILAITCLDDKKIEIQSSLNSKELLYFLSGPQTKIISFEDGKIKGIGPFNIQIAKESIQLIKNAYYYDAKNIFMNEVKLVVKDDKTALVEYVKGEIDLILLSNMDGLLLSDHLSNDGEAISTNLWSTWGIAFNQRIRPFNNKDLRQCLIQSVNSEEWVKTFYPNNLPAYGAIPFGLIGHAKSRIDDDKKEFKKIKEQVEVYLPKEIDNSENVASWVKSKFSSCVIAEKIKMKITPFSQMLELFNSNKMGAFLMSFNKESIGDDQYYKGFYSKGEENYYGNYSKQTKKQFLILKTAKNADLQNLSKSIAKSLHGDALMVPLMHPIHKVLVKKCLIGLVLNPINEGYFLFRGMKDQCN